MIQPSVDIGDYLSLGFSNRYGEDYSSQSNVSSLKFVMSLHPVVKQHCVQLLEPKVAVGLHWLYRHMARIVAPIKFCFF